jgi:NADH dehydrogenase
MSALGADSHGPSMYLRSKGDGEAAVRAEEAGLRWTILRPSVVFGEDDDFLNLFARLQRHVPVVLLGAASQRFAPVYVGDLAQAVVSSLIGPRAPATLGRIYELGGPQVFTLRELVHKAGVWAGVNQGRGRPVLGLPHPLAVALATLLEFAPGGPLMSRDNLDSMRVASVPDGKLAGFAPELGVAHPASAEALAPAWLRHLGPQAEYSALRSHAGR